MGNKLYKFLKITGMWWYEPGR